MTTNNTPSTSMTWLSLHTKILSDARFMRLSDSARLAFLLLLPLTAAQGLNGLVPSDAGDVQFVIRLKGGEDATAQAIAELLSCGLLVTTDDDEQLLISGWSKNQRPDKGGSETRPASSSRGQLIRYHNEGKHAEKPQEKCELCQQAPPAVKAARKSLTKAATNDEPTMTEMLADFRTVTIPEFLSASGSPFEGYIRALGEAETLAAVAEELKLSDKPLGALRNEVLAHALRNLVDESISYPAITRANKAAKALGDDGHKWWVHACVASASRKFADEDHIINSLTGTAQRARSKGLSA
ncbi:hypothetical protein [uncultured Friedmanniella sp.]|uniref:hypothetical protein n=1 Tax=uncultured Friedmanniella sp. TaxID=335381 RepID=UPI0035CB4F2E